MKNIFYDGENNVITAGRVTGGVMEKNHRFQKRHSLEDKATQDKKYFANDPDASVDAFFIGASKPIVALKEQIKSIAQLDTTTLIAGETGTGKELVARAIEKYSGNPSKPMVKVNCTTLAPQLFESELFGHEKGSFTGADSRVLGKFELANNGIIFLDEIGDLPLDLQPKLLRVIQEKEIMSIGGSQTLKLNVKIVAATNRDLHKEVQEGRFREDLYYRLSVIPLVLPPLRERKEDIPMLSEHFLKRYEKKLGKRGMSFSESSIKKLISHDWPGNVRELQHLIEREMILSKSKTIDISLDHKADPEERKKENTGFETLVELEKQHIQKVLEKTNGRVRGKQGAAEILAINPSTLESRIRKLGISKKSILR